MRLLQTNNGIGDVVGIEYFGIPTLQDAALAKRLAIVQAFPGFEDIGQSLFSGGVIYFRWSHNGFRLGKNIDVYPCLCHPDEAKRRKDLALNLARDSARCFTTFSMTLTRKING